MTIIDLGVGAEEIEKEKWEALLQGGKYWDALSRNSFIRKGFARKNKFISIISSPPPIINGRPLRSYNVLKIPLKSSRVQFYTWIGIGITDMWQSCKDLGSLRLVGPSKLIRDFGISSLFKLGFWDSRTPPTGILGFQDPPIQGPTSAWVV